MLVPVRKDTTNLRWTTSYAYVSPLIITVSADDVPCNPAMKSLAFIYTDESMITVSLGLTEYADKSWLDELADPPEGTTDNVSVAAVVVVLLIAIDATFTVVAAGTVYKVADTLLGWPE